MKVVCVACEKERTPSAKEFKAKSIVACECGNGSYYSEQAWAQILEKRQDG